MSDNFFAVRLRGQPQETAPAETPWFGQLMAGPQMLAYLLQINFWMSRYGVEISQ